MGSFVVEHSVIPRRAGTAALVALFNSEGLVNIRGAHQIRVAYA